MSLPAISGDELLAWVEKTSAGWCELVTNHPEILTLPCDIRETKSISQLLQHIVAVELRYAQRLHGLAETSYSEIPYDSAQSIYATHQNAMNLLGDLQDKDDSFWAEWIDFQTRRGGPLRVPRRFIYGHLLMHSIRHYAQLATLVRSHGIAPGWPMDYLFMRPEE